MAFRPAHGAPLTAALDRSRATADPLRVRQRTLVAVLAAILVGCGSPTPPATNLVDVTVTADPGAPAAADATPTPTPTPTPVPTPRPKPGHEVYGYVPYWEMDAGSPHHLAATDLTTLALFSVTNRSNGSLITPRTGTGGSPGRSGAR